MKKAVHTAPKQRLKEERELRGWSQKYVAEQIGADHYYLSATLNEWGKLHLKLAQFDAASAAFHEVEAIASSSGNQALIAGAFYGLARVALAQGNLIEARRLGLDSLAIFEKIGHRMASEVKQWLEALPRGKQG